MAKNTRAARNTRALDVDDTEPTDDPGARPAVAVKLDGREYVVDIDSMTMAEVQLVRRTIAGLGYPAGPEDGFLVGLWVTMLRTKPSLRFDTLSKQLTSGELRRLMADAQSIDPEVDDPEG